MLQEFIDEIQKAHAAIKENEQMKVEIKALEESRDKYKDEVDSLTLQVKELENNEELESANERIQELEEFQPNYEFEGIGIVKIYANNLADREKIESLFSSFKRIS